VHQAGLALVHASAELKADRELVLTAVQRNGRALHFAVASLKSDRQIVLAAMEQNPTALELAAEPLQTLLRAAPRSDGDAEDLPPAQVPGISSEAKDEAAQVTEQSTSVQEGVAATKPMEAEATVKQEAEECKKRQVRDADEAEEQRLRVRVKQEGIRQRAQEAEDGISAAPMVDLTDEPPRPAHLPANWDGMADSERQAWVYDWHQAHPGQRMCPKCQTSCLVMYILKQMRNGRSQFTCNSISCRCCFTEFCLNCGAAKGGGRGSGYHRECGRQPSWLIALEQVSHLSNDDPRVQQPPPLMRRS